jgi:hypothetical protein
VAVVAVLGRLEIRTVAFLVAMVLLRVLRVLVLHAQAVVLVGGTVAQRLLVGMVVAVVAVILVPAPAWGLQTRVQAVALAEISSSLLVS